VPSSHPLNPHFEWNSASRISRPGAVLECPGSGTKHPDLQAQENAVPSHTASVGHIPMALAAGAQFAPLICTRGVGLPFCRGLSSSPARPDYGFETDRTVIRHRCPTRRSNGVPPQKCGSPGKRKERRFLTRTGPVAESVARELRRGTTPAADVRGPAAVAAPVRGDSRRRAHVSAVNSIGLRSGTRAATLMNKEQG
jgi:hypothetical protein